MASMVTSCPNINELSREAPQVLAQEFRLTEGRAMPYEPQAEEHLSQGPIVFIKTSSVHNVFTGVRMSSGPSVHTCPLHRC